MQSPGDEPLAAGTVIDGRYRVIAELGAGGMGRVYEAEHMFIRRAMALKLLRAAAGAEAAARMVQEATLAGQVPHPAVVRVFDCAALADGQVYVAMELLRGETLEQALRRGVDAATALGVLAEVARGLAAVHRVGVVHRDIKPANIFLARVASADAGVQAKLLDFGVAKALPGASELAAGAVRTQAGAVLGTPFYVAPEQVRGGALDGRADLYGLGVIAYEVLTGELPFVGASYVEILGKHVREAPLDPRQAAPGRGIPDAAARLTMRLLAKEPGERGGDGDAVAGEIAAVLAAEGEALRGLVTGGARAEVSGAGTVRLAEASGAGTVRLAEGTGVGAGMVRLAGGTGAEASGAGTVRLAGGTGAEASGAATVRLAGGTGAGTVRLAEGTGVDAETVRLAEASGAATVRLAEGTGAGAVAEVTEGTGAAREVSRGTGAWRRWTVVAIGLVGVAWAWVLGRVPAEAVAPAEVPAGGEPAREVPAVREVPASPVRTAEAPRAPTKIPEPAATPAATQAAEKQPVAKQPATKPAAIIKGKKSGRDGGTNRPPAKAPTKAGDPELKPDVYDD